MPEKQASYLFLLVFFFETFCPGCDSAPKLRFGSPRSFSLRSRGLLDIFWHFKSVFSVLFCFFCRAAREAGRSACITCELKTSPAVKERASSARGHFFRLLSLFVVGSFCWSLFIWLKAGPGPLAAQGVKNERFSPPGLWNRSTVNQTPPRFCLKLKRMVHKKSLVPELRRKEHDNGVDFKPSNPHI